MDYLIEKIVKKKFGFREYAIMIGVFLAVPVAAIIMASIPFFATSLIFFVIIVFLAYWAWVLASYLVNIEYEYTLTNDELDIDMILNQKKRKKLFSASCKEFTIVAKKSNENHVKEHESAQNKIIACTSLNSPDVYFAIMNYNGQMTALYFEPSQKMLEAFKVFIPKNVYI